jgi:hypothetical protein
MPAFPPRFSHGRFTQCVAISLRHPPEERSQSARSTDLASLLVQLRRLCATGSSRVTMETPAKRRCLNTRRHPLDRGKSGPAPDPTRYRIGGAAHPATATGCPVARLCSPPRWRRRDRCPRSAIARARHVPGKRETGPRLSFRSGYRTNSGHRLTRQSRILQDRAEHLPALAVEPHHLELLVDAVVGRRGVDFDPG